VAEGYSGSWPGKGTDGVTPGTIVLLDPLTATEGITISGPAGKYPPLVLSAQAATPDMGHIALAENFSGSLITVRQGVTLTLTNIVLLKGNASNTAPLVKVDGGHLILKDGAIITGNTNGDWAAHGGGVAVNGGTFTMSAGMIINNFAGNGSVSSGWGGGVFVNGGTFTMSGGIIRNNATGGYGGGVFIHNNSMFTMSGGEISNNQSYDYGGGVYVDVAGRFEMSSGVIRGNYTGGEDTGVKQGGGVFVNSGGTFIKKPAADSSTSGIIYGDSNHSRGDGEATDNTALVAGNAVYSSNNGSKVRDATAGEDDEIDTTDGTGFTD
jgi:hypothetical protein